MKYLEQIEKITQILGLPQIAEFYEGHPDDESIVEEYYFPWSFRDEEADKFKFLLDFLIEEHWQLDTNVLTIYN